MTQETEAPNVTQADREAAAGVAWKSPAFLAAIRAGQHDDCDAVQAFARHRLSHSTPGDAEVRKALADLLAGIAHPTAGLEWTLPWRVRPCDGKPTIVSNKGGNLFRGYIGTWREADLIVATVNALPGLLANPSGRVQGEDE